MNNVVVMNSSSNSSADGAPSAPSSQPSTAANAATLSAPASKKPLNLEPMFNVLNMIGLSFVTPIVRLCRGENPRAQARDLWQLLGIPLVAIAVFVFAWSRASHVIETSLGKIPGPVAVWTQVGTLWADHKMEREKAWRSRAAGTRNAGKIGARPRPTDCSQDTGSRSTSTNRDHLKTV